MLKEFLTADPDNVTLSLMRAQILADSLETTQGRTRTLAARSPSVPRTPAPLVQLAQLDMDQNDLDAAAATIAKIRSRWKESATGDILEGQLALKRGKIAGRSRALHRGPQERPGQQDRPVLEGPARQPDRLGDRSDQDARRPGQERPSKEVDAGRHPDVGRPVGPGQPLAPDRNVRRRDPPIRGAEASNQTGTLSRYDRWQLITAYVAKGQWPIAKREIAAHPQRPQESADRRRAGPGRELLPAAKRGRRRPGSARLCAQGEPDQCRGGGHPVVHPPERQEVRGSGRDPAQGDRAGGQETETSRQPSST